MTSDTRRFAPAIEEELPMRKHLLLAALLTIHAAPVDAQINLAWRNCITVTTGTTAALANVSYACDGNGTLFKGVASFVAPAGVTQFVGVEATIEISTTSPTLPDFWRLAVGECRDGNFIFPGGFVGIGTGATGVCQNPYLGGSTSAGYDYQS